MNGIGYTPAAARHLVELDRVEAMRLLSEAAFGRIVFTLNALPAIRPVNHLVDDGQIIIRTRLTAKVAGAVRAPHDPVVAFEADDLDPVHRLGWSVVVTGLARTLTDPVRITRYEGLLHPWVDHVMNTVIVIQPEIIAGFRLTQTP